MGLVNAIFGALIPRFILLVAWSNDQAYWNGLLGSAVWLGLGWLFLPWTTLMYAAMWSISSNEVSGWEWIVVAIAFLVDVYTWALARRSLQ